MKMHSIDSEKVPNADTLQKPNIYNQYSPFHESMKQHASLLFDEIRENLSRTIQLDELNPGFSVWSDKLKRFISLYGFNFTKSEHLKLIELYLSILSITNLNYLHAQICFDTLFQLMRFVFVFSSNIKLNFS